MTTTLVVALLVASGVLGYLVWADHREDRMRTSAVEESTRLVDQLAADDHHDVDADPGAVVTVVRGGDRRLRDDAQLA